MASREPSATVNGIEPISVEVSQSRTKSGDLFHAELPLAFGTWDGNEIPVQVMMGNDGAADTLMFDGFVDSVEPYFDKGTVIISGRNKVSKLIDKTTRKKWLNQTPDDVVQELAGNAGLSVDSDGISDKAGKIYQIDWNKFIHDLSDWSLINNLADLFGMNAYVTGSTLYFKNLNEDLPAISINYVPPTPESFADGSFIELTGRRNLVVAAGATVNVQSWNHKQKKVVKSTKGSGSARYNYTLPGLTQSQADKIASKKLRENSAHGKAIRLDIPGDTGISARMSVTLSGTGSVFDDTYENESVMHRMNLSDGFRTTISAKIPGTEG